MNMLMKSLMATVALSLLPAMGQAATITLYDSLPSPVPGNEPSQGFECCQVRQLGQGVNLVTGGTFANFTVNVLMSDWAIESTYEAVGTSAGFNVPITLNLFNVGAGNTVGSLIATQTISEFIPWRPESDGCGDGAGYTSGANCFHGSLSQISFNFGTQTVPGQVIFGVAYNTQTVGYTPTGVAGPYNSLNVGLSSTAPSIGSNLTAGSLFVDGQTCYPYTDCTGGPNQFRQDPGWDPYTPSASITGDELSEVPEPGTLVLFGTGLCVAAAKIRRKKQA